MTPERFRRVHALLDAVREISPDERDAWLDANCDDPGLRAEVTTLLAHDAQAHALLDAPLFELGAALGLEAPTPATAPPLCAPASTDRASSGAPTKRAGRWIVPVVLVPVLIAGIFLARLIVGTAQGPPGGETTDKSIEERSVIPATAPDLEPAATAIKHGDVSQAKTILNRVPVAKRAWEWNALAHRIGLRDRAIGSHVGRINGLAWSPDERLLATIQQSGPVRIFGSVGGASAQTLPQDETVARGLAFSRFGATLTVVEREAISRWSLATGTRFDRQATAAPIAIATWDRTGQRLATADENGAICVRAADGADAPMSIAPAGQAVLALVLSEGGVLVAAATADHVRAWSVDDARYIGTWPVAAARALAFAPSSECLVAATYDDELVVVDIATSTIQTHGHLETSTSAITFDATGRRLAVAHDSDEISVWSWPDPRRIGSFSGCGQVNTLATMGDRFASASDDGIVHTWTWKGPDAIAAHGAPTTDLRVGNGTVLIVATDDGGKAIASTYDLLDGRHIHETALSGPVDALDHHDNDVVFVTADQFCRVQMTLPNDPSDPRRECVVMGQAILDVAVLPEQDRVVVALGSRVAVVGFDGEPPRFADVPANQVAVGARGRLVAAIGPEVTVLHAATMEPLCTVAAPAGVRRSITFAPDGRLLVAADEHLILLDVESGSQVSLPLPDGRRGPPVALRDGARLAVVDADGAVRILDTSTGITTVTLPTGRARATGVIGTDPTGEILVIALDDGTLQVWTGQRAPHHERPCELGVRVAEDCDADS